MKCTKLAEAKEHMKKPEERRRRRKTEGGDFQKLWEEAVL